MGIVLAAGLIPLAVVDSVCIGVLLLALVNRKSCLEPYIVVLTCDGADSEAAAFINALAALEGVRSAVLVSYNGDYMG